MHYIIRSIADAIRIVTTGEPISQYNYGGVYMIS